MHAKGRHVLHLCIAYASVLTIACHESLGPPVPANGDLVVSVTSAGLAADRDLDGYYLVIDGVGAGNISSLPTATVSRLLSLPLGHHIIRLEALAPNCAAEGTNERSVDVTSNQTAIVSFAVSCVPNIGTVRLTTSTTIAGLKSDDYRYNTALPGVGSVVLPANATTTFANIRAGVTQIALVSVPPNCAVDGSNLKTLNVVFNSTVDLSFTIRCVTPGSLQIKIATTGVSPDLDGYGIRLTGPPPASYLEVQAASNGTLSVSQLRPGVYSLTIFGMSGNCALITPGLEAVTVTASVDTPVVIQITCDTPTPIAYVGEFDRKQNIFVINSDGTGANLLTRPPGANVDPAWSPDGQRIAFSSSRDGNFRIYVMRADGTDQVRLTSTAANDYQPAWSPDGNRIAFVSGRDGNLAIFVMNADGTNPVRLTSTNEQNVAPEWSPDGSQIAFERSGPQNDPRNGIWTMNADGSNATQLTNHFRDSRPAWSPDGTKIAFARTDEATGLFTINRDKTGLKQLTNGYLVSNPSWSANGRNIVFESYADCYYYYCDTNIRIVGPDGGTYQLPILKDGSNPAWRR